MRTEQIGHEQGAQTASLGNGAETEQFCCLGIIRPVHLIDILKEQVKVLHGVERVDPLRCRIIVRGP